MFHPLNDLFRCIKYLFLIRIPINEGVNEIKCGNLMNVRNKNKDW